MKLGIWGEFSIPMAALLRIFKRMKGGRGMHFDRNFEGNVGRVAYAACITSWSFDSN
jgi:hypothetical protein